MIASLQYPVCKKAKLLRDSRDTRGETPNSAVFLLHGKIASWLGIFTFVTGQPFSWLKTIRVYLQGCWVLSFWALWYGRATYHVRRFPRPSPPFFAYCKRSKTGGVESLGMSLVMWYFLDSTIQQGDVSFVHAWLYLAGTSVLNSYYLHKLFDIPASSRGWTTCGRWYLGLRE